MALEHVYVKDLSFESPRAPAVFAADVDTQIQLDVQSKSRGMDEETAEVTLTVTLKAMAQQGTVFLVEVEQAGIFRIRGFLPEERFALLATECPLILYSYARVTVADAVSKGGFSEFLLQPLDFHDLYRQNMQAQPGHPTAGH